MYGDKNKCSYFINHLVLTLNIVILIPRAQSLKNGSTYPMQSPHVGPFIELNPPKFWEDCGAMNRPWVLVHTWHSQKESRNLI